MTIYHVPSTRSRLTLLPLKLHRFTAPPPPETLQEESGEADTTEALRTFVAGIRTAPVRDAYVVALPSSGPGGAAYTSTSGPSVEDAIVAMTDGEGSIRNAVTPYLDAEGDILFQPGAQYEIFWTYRRSVLDEAMGDLETEGPTAAVLTRYGFKTYVLDPEEVVITDLRFRLLSPHTPPPELVALFRALSSAGMGYLMFDGGHLGIVDRTGPLLALYAAEFAMLHAAAAIAETMPEWSRLHHVEQMIAVEQAGQPPEDVEAVFDSFDRHNIEVLDRYRRYALECARDPAVERRVYIRAIHVVFSHDGAWLDAAEAIRRPARTGPVHPCFDFARERVVMGSQFVDALEFYFDFYRLAIRERTHGFPAALGEAVRRKTQALHALERWVSELVHARLVHPAFLLDLDWHLPEDRAPRRALFQRYLTVCTCVEFRFWEGLHDALDGSLLLRNALGWAGSGGSDFADVIGRFWESHVHGYRLRAAEAETMLNEMVRYNHAAGGTGPATIRRGDMTVVVDFENQVLEVRSPSIAGGTRIEELRFARLTDAAGAPTTVTRYVPATDTTETFTHSVPVDLEDMHAAPEALRTLACLVNIGLTISNVSRALRERDVTTFVTLVENGLELVEAAGNIMSLLPGRSAEFRRLASRLSGVGGAASTFLSAGLMFAEGSRILFLPSGSVSVALQRHDTTQAGLMAARGSVLFIGGGYGVASMSLAAAGAVVEGVAIGTAVAAAAVPVGLVTTVVGLVVLGIDLAACVRTGGPSQLEEFDDGFLGAKRDEFYGGDAPESDDAAVRSRTAGRLWGLHSNLQSLMS